MAFLDFCSLQLKKSMRKIKDEFNREQTGPLKIFQLFAAASPAPGFSPPGASPGGPYPPLPLNPPLPLKPSPLPRPPLMNGGKPPRPLPLPMPPAPSIRASISMGLLGLARPLPGILILLDWTVNWRPLNKESY